MLVAGQERWRLFLSHAPGLRAYIRRRVRDSMEAEEVFQDLSLIVIGHRAALKDAEHFSAWCYAVVRHVLARHLRTKRRRAELLSRVEFETSVDEVGHRVDPERAATAREALRTLGKSLDRPARELLVQRYLLGESTEEIARQLRESPAAVRMRLMRLRSVARRKSP
jgi:RNA polymerase sigma factor (sigma-70 family)